MSVTSDVIISYLLPSDQIYCINRMGSSKSVNSNIGKQMIRITNKKRSKCFTTITGKFVLIDLLEFE